MPVTQDKPQPITLGAFLGRDYGYIPHSGRRLRKQINGEGRIVLMENQHTPGSILSDLFWSSISYFVLISLPLLVIIGITVALADNMAGRVALVIVAVPAGIAFFAYFFNHYKKMEFLSWDIQKYLDRDRRELVIEASGYNNQTGNTDTVLERVPMQHMTLRVQTVQLSDSSMTNTMLVLTLNDDVRSEYENHQFNPDTAVYVSSESTFYEWQIKPGKDLLEVGRQLSQMLGLTFDEHLKLPSSESNDPPSKKQSRQQRKQITQQTKKIPRRKYQRKKK